MLFRPTLLAGLMLVTSLALAQPPAAEPAKPAESPAPAKAEEKTVYVLMSTSMGDVTMELDAEKAPISVANFLSYVDKKHYDGTIFHRVIKTFMIQGGGYTADISEKKGTDKPIKNEWKNGLKNTRGTVAMARLGDRQPNPKTVDSATSQFFINVVDNAFLDRPQPDGGAYAVFGRVISGMDVVDKIKDVPTGNKSGMQDVPVETVEIKSIKRITAEEAKAAKK